MHKRNSLERLYPQWCWILRITNAQFADSGTYSCSLKMGRGEEVEDKITVVVKGTVDIFFTMKYGCFKGSTFILLNMFSWQLFVRVFQKLKKNMWIIQLMIARCTAVSWDLFPSHEMRFDNASWLNSPRNNKIFIRVNPTVFSPLSLSNDPFQSVD